MSTVAASFSRGDGASDSGKWWVENDQLCQQWTSWMDGKILLLQAHARGLDACTGCATTAAPARRGSAAEPGAVLALSSDTNFQTSRAASGRLFAFCWSGAGAACEFTRRQTRCAKDTGADRKRLQLSGRLPVTRVCVRVIAVRSVPSVVCVLFRLRSCELRS